jgi:hypothetical protein
VDTTKSKKISLVLGFMALLIVASVALADVVQTGYRTLRGDEPAAVAAQTSATAAQSAVWTDTPINPISTNGNPHVLCEANFQTSGATCVVTVGRYMALATDPVTYAFLGVESQTLTASTTQTDDGAGSALRYLAAAPKSFDTYSASHYDLRMAAPSSGSATLKHYPYGAAKRDEED